MAERNPPSWMNVGSHSAENDRLTLLGLLSQEGVKLAGDLKVTAPGGMNVAVAAGQGWVKGTSSANQGIYSVYNDASVTKVVPTADATNPRKDIVVARVIDAQYVGGGVNAWDIGYIAGSPAGAPVEPALPVSCLKLATVDVPAGDLAIDAGQITDRRTTVAATGGIVICTSGTRPLTPIEGQVIYETDTDLIYSYNGSAWKLLGTQTVGRNVLTGAAASIGVTLPTVTGGRHLRLIGKVQHATGISQTVGLRFNGDAGATKYRWQNMAGFGTSVNAGQDVSDPFIFIGFCGNESVSRFSPFTLDIPDFLGTYHKAVTGSYLVTGNVTGMILYQVAGFWADAAAITSVEIVSAAGNFAVGSELQVEISG